LKILMVSGGTGGHIYPALALADYMKNRGHEIVFIGNDDRMEATIIPEHGYPFFALHTSGFTGSIFNKMKAVMQSVWARKKAKKILNQVQPDVVVGFGGYVCVPVIMSAAKLHIKVILHEQNSIAGAANRILAKYANAVVICYEHARADFLNSKVYLLGNPRATYAAMRTSDEEYFQTLGLVHDKPLVLIVMGSLGSSSITTIMKDVLNEIKHVNFLYVSGKQNYSQAKQMLTSENVTVVDYVDQLAIIDKFDLIICRAGATTAAEITASGICSILIPSPYVAHNHQYFNAKSLVDEESALMIEEKDLNTKVLCDKINMVLNDSQIREKMRKNAKRLGYVNACEDIATLIEKL